MCQYINGEKMKKKIINKVVLFAVCVVIVATMIVVHRKQEEKKYGILLAFDDYAVESWENAFDLFDKYDVNVNFFINATEPTEFCFEAERRGHEIGFHTKGHAKLTEVSEEEFYEETVSVLDDFRNQGIEMTSFAYPYGEYEEWMNVELLRYYDTVRGAWIYRGYNRESISEGFVEAISIDNLHFESDEEFRREIQKMLDDLLACEEGTVVSMFSHGIDAGDWCISPERLEILFQEAEKRGIEFYTFRELQ